MTSLCDLGFIGDWCTCNMESWLQLASVKVGPFSLFSFVVTHIPDTIVEHL